MKSVIILLTLSIFHFLVQETSSASPRLIDSSRGNYGGTATKKYKPPNKQGDYYEEANSATFFPGNAMLLFQLKTAIQSSLHKIEDDEDSLERIKYEIILLKGLSAALFSYLKNGVEGLMTDCVFLADPATLPPPIKVGNKCYSISDVVPGGVSSLNYARARQTCLAHGGDLANPFLLAGGTFGTDLKDAIVKAMAAGTITSGGTASNYWISGNDVPAPGFITTETGFKIPNTLFRYFDVGTFPFVASQVIPADSRLTIVGSLLAIQSDWYIAPMPKTTVLPFICEFSTVVNLPEIASYFYYEFRTNKSPLIQNFLRKVRLIQNIKSEISTPLIGAANQKTEHSIFDAVSKEPQNAKITENAENEKEIEEIKFDQSTKTDEAVEKVENAKPVEMSPAVVKKDKPLEIKKDRPLETEKENPLETEKDQPLETEKDKPLETKKDKPIETEKDQPLETEKDKPLETKKDRPLETEKENPLETEKDKPLETEKDKPLETKKDKPIETDKDKPLEIKKDKPLETKKVLNKEEMKAEEEIPNRQGEIAPNKEVVVEDDKNVNEKKILLEDILGKLEKLESFRAIKQ